MESEEHRGWLLLPVARQGVVDFEWGHYPPLSDNVDSDRVVSLAEVCLPAIGR